MENEILTIDSFVVDTIKSSMNTLKVINQLPEQKSILQDISSVATAIIAIVNVVLIIYFFVKKNKKDDSDKEQNRKLNLLKTLVLDYNMNKFYSFFNEVVDLTDSLKDVNISIEQKQDINEKVKDCSSALLQNFTDLFLAVDEGLYQRILERTDLLIDSLTDTMFDEGINLSHQPKFKELISDRITKSKTEIMRFLFSYTGE